MNLYIKPSAIIFDFDDTLVDAKVITKRALMNTLAKLNLSEDLIKQKNIDTSLSLRDYFAEIFADDLDVAKEIYYRLYTEYSKELRAFEDAEKNLALLLENQVFTVIVSNKGGERLRTEIKDKFSWNKYFSAIIGSGDTEEDKPSIIPAQSALVNSGLKSYQDVWFIGDSLVDMKAAEALGCRAILYGDLKIPDNFNYNIYLKVQNHEQLNQILEKIYA